MSHAHLYRLKTCLGESSCPKRPNLHKLNNSLIERGLSQNMQHAVDIRTSSARHGGRVTFATMKMNAYGRWAGAPGGSGSSPQNHF